VREAVLDASVVLEWFTGAAGTKAGVRRLRAKFEAGDLIVLAPPLLNLEVLNVAGRRWGWSGGALLTLARTLDDLAFDLVEPRLDGVARWVAKGLTAYDAAYVSLAEAARVPLFSQDDAVLRVATGVARRPR
jgi:predicted nucleic acid-binding protein